MRFSPVCRALHLAYEERFMVVNAGAYVLQRFPVFECTLQLLLHDLHSAQGLFQTFQALRETRGKPPHNH
jgi:hypothetical protein